VTRPGSAWHSSRIVEARRDALKRYALQNASSISGLLLTTEALVTELPEKEKPAPAGGPGVKTMTPEEVY